MELLYLWVDHYRNIAGQEFNFSSKYSFSYKSDAHLLEITERSEQPTDFFHHHISNITAIIGRNGAGKSNLVDLLRVIFNDAIDNHLELFLVFQEKPGAIEVFHPFDTSLFRVEGNGKLRVYNHQLNVGSNQSQELGPFSILNHSATVFISPNIDFKTSLHSGLNEINLSADALLSNEIAGMPPNQDQVLEYLQVQQVGRQVDFITSSYTFELPFRIPERLHIKLFQKDLTIHSGPARDALEHFKEIWQNENKELTQQEEQQNLWGHKVSSFKLQRLRNNFTGMILRIVMFNLWNTDTQFYTVNNYKELELPRFIERFRLWLRGYSPLNEGQMTAAYNFLSKGLSLINNCEWSEEVGENWFVINAESFYEVKDSYLEFTSRFKDAYSLEFNWVSSSPFQGGFRKHVYQPHHLSSGEARFLDLFSKFYYARTYLDARKQDEKNIRFLYILIDEGETGFHPQWQKEYLLALVRQLPVIFEGYRLQIILTTHSPIIASDLPMDNIIFLDRDSEGWCRSVRLGRDEETFGANIYSLYTDAFFLQKGLMGEFAKHKINAAIRWLKGDENIPKETKNSAEKLHQQMDEKRARYIIEHIGEPVLRKKLSQLFQDIENDRNK